MILKQTRKSDEWHGDRITREHGFLPSVRLLVTLTNRVDMFLWGKRGQRANFEGKVGILRLIVEPKTSLVKDSGVDLAAVTSSELVGMAVYVLDEGRG